MLWNSLLTSDVGLFSLFVIVFIIGMGIWFARFFKKKMHEEEARMRPSNQTK